MTKVILSRKSTSAAAETSTRVVLAAGMSPPSPLLHFSMLGAGGGTGSGLLGQLLQVERWPVEPQTTVAPVRTRAPLSSPGSGSGGALLAPGSVPVYGVLPAASGSKILLASL